MTSIYLRRRAINPELDAQGLAEIAVSAKSALSFGMEPKVAMLSKAGLNQTT